MQYSATVPFRGDVGKAFDLAVASLTALGFRITAKDRAALEFAGPGMAGSRQSALLGATHLRITADRDSVRPTRLALTSPE